MKSLEHMVEVLNSNAIEKIICDSKQVLRPSTYAKSPKPCLMCGETFNGTSRAMYCSNKCKQKNKRLKGIR